MHSRGRYPPRVRRFAGLLLAAAVSLLVAGMGMGHGSVLAIGLVLAPFAQGRSDAVQVEVRTPTTLVASFANADAEPT